MSESPDLHNNAADTAEDEIDLAELWGVLRSGWRVVVGVTAIAILFGVAYLLITPPVYRADALLQVQDNGPSPALPQLAALAMGGQMSSAETQMQIIASRSVLGHVVDDLGLAVTTQPNYFPVLGWAVASRREAMPSAQQAVSADQGSRLGRYAWQPTNLVVSALSIPEMLDGKAFTLRALGGGQYVLFGPDGHEVLSGQVGAPASGHTAVGQPVKMFVQKLTAPAPPTDFTVVRNTWLPVVNGLHKRLGVSEQGKGTGVIQVSLEGTDRQAITRIVNAVANDYVRQNVEAHSEQAKKSLEFLSEQLPEIRNKLDQAVTRLTDYREKYQAVGLDAQSQALLKQWVALESKRSQLKLKRQELSETYTEKFPAIAAIREQLGGINEQKQALQKKIDQLPGSQKQMLGLKRAVKLNTTLYTSLLDRAQQLRVAKASTTGNVRIIDHAVMPVKAVAPRKALILALALVLGGMIGCGVVLLRAALRRTIDDPRDIEQLFGVPVYAVIPFSDLLGKLTRRAKRQRRAPPILARDCSDEVATEALRSMRTSLYFAQMESGNNVILVSGPSPGVGKSFVSVNLGYLLGDAGKKTVVVDADMRRGKLHEMVGGEREPGLSQILTGQVTLQQALRPLGDSGCHVIAGGQVPPNPSELLMRESFGDLLAQLKEEYDYVIVDAPPILAVTDAAVIAGTMPGIITFLIARAGMHPKAEIEESLNRMARNGTKVAGMVFNGLTSEHGARSGGSTYHYQYEYKS